MNLPNEIPPPRIPFDPSPVKMYKVSAMPETKRSNFPAHVAMADIALVDAQKEFERFTGLENDARDFLAAAQIAYDLALSDFIKRNLATGSITVLKELARGECRELFTAYVLAETDLKKIMAGKELQEQRINTAKTLIRLRLENMG